jgi:hypothetical protein
MTKRVALYARVSVDRNQTVENQLRQLNEVAVRLGWTVVAVYADEGSTRCAVQRLTKAEDTFAFRVKKALTDELADVASGDKCWIGLHERGGPEATSRVLLIHMRFDVWSLNSDERPREPLVSRDKLVTEGKNVHHSPTDATSFQIRITASIPILEVLAPAAFVQG